METGHHHHQVRAGRGIRLLKALALTAIVLWVVAVWLSVEKVGRPFPGFLVEPALNFGIDNDSHWKGYQSGLRRADALYEGNGIALRTHDDLDRLVRSVPVGTPIRYSYMRLGEARTVVVPTQAFTWREFAPHFFPHLLLSGVFLAIGLFSFLMARTNPAAQAFLLLMLAIGVSLAALNDWHWNPRAFGFEFRYLLSMVASASFLHFALVFPMPKSFLRAKRLPLVYVVYLPAIAMALAGIAEYHSFSQPIAAEHWKAYLGLWQRNSWLMLLCFGWLMASVMHAAFRAESLLERKQAKIMLVGGAIAMSSQLMAISVPQILGISSQVPPFLSLVGNVLGLAFPVSVSLAILRHRLFNIELIIKRTIAYVGVVGILTGVYFALVAVLRALLDQLLGPTNATIYNVPATATVAVLFAPVRDQTKELVDRLFFRESYDFRQVVSRVAEHARDLPSSRRVADLAMATVEAALHPTYSAVLLCSATTAELEIVAAQGDPPSLVGRIPVDHPILRDLQANGGGVTPAPLDLEGFKSVLVCPLLVQAELMGCVLIGPRKADLPYDDQDRLLIDNLGQQLEKKLQQEELARKDAETLRVRGMLSRYVSPQVADTLLKKDFDLSQGQRQRVTLLFSDIRGFTKMSEVMPPEEVVSVLNAYFSRMVGAVFAFDGMLDKYIGDGMMVVFGAPVPREDHAWRAVQAALRMRHELELFNLERAEAGLAPLKIGIGLNTGECVIGNIGTEQRLDYTAIGDTVNTASRIESLTKEYEADILMSAATYEQVQEFVEVQRVEEVAIRGKVERLDLFVLQGLKPGLPQTYLSKKQTGPLSHPANQPFR